MDGNQNHNLLTIGRILFCCATRKPLKLLFMVLHIILITTEKTSYTSKCFFISFISAPLLIFWSSNSEIRVYTLISYHLIAHFTWLNVLFFNNNFQCHLRRPVGTEFSTDLIKLQCAQISAFMFPRHCSGFVLRFDLTETMSKHRNELFSFCTLSVCTMWLWSHCIMNVFVYSTPSPLLFSYPLSFTIGYFIPIWDKVIRHS